MGEGPGGLERVRDRVARACERSGREPSQVRIVAVAKGRSAGEIERVVGAGVADIGENRAQELRDHQRDSGVDVRWHYVGALQTNKVRYLDDVSLIHSLDRAREAEALQARAEALSRSFDVLVQVNVSGEMRKQGVPPDAAGDLLDALGSYPLVLPRGFMVVAPRTEKEEDVRWVFTQTRELRDSLGGARAGLGELSMGMSNDYEIAIEEGATIVRIGRAIFAAEV